MGHPGNWTPRKREHVRRENAVDDRERLREVTLHQHSAAALNGQVGPDFFRMHPCITFQVCRFKVVATCVGCLRTNEVTPYAFEDSPLAHRFWPYVMGELICPACGSCPRELRFRDYRGSDVGAISLEASITLYIADHQDMKQPVRSEGEIDPFAQHDDGGSANAR